ncbi:peptidase M42 [Clostridium novyi]|uniref:Endoglucanase, aminopeptidase M42 family n=1 Tax=Clostridium novyi (strain NT) TaxID=386415 RepID=A0Q3P6_CLONN|nr:peptidase M42 [Clostridium novyi]ABK60844.1 endoglucanase, aminopeptidase M42 family [Clostridium novyi NT]KEH84894.1 peptidase M42 [Clostridium novyi A str. NCTC 538]
MDKLIESLIDSFGVSTKENKLKSIIKEQINLIQENKKVNIDVLEDDMGNLIAKMGNGKEKLMLCTHMDNTGLMATEIDDRGFVKVIPIGDVNLKNISGSFFKTEDGKVARIGFLKEDSSKDNLFVDFGVSNKEAAKSKIAEGEALEILGQKIEVENKIIAPNIHSRIACYVLLKVMENMDIYKVDKEILFVFSVQKELGFKGAKISAVNIKPNTAIVLDSMESGDNKGGDLKISLENGPVLSVFDRSLVIHHKVKELIETSAEDLGIKLQYSIGMGQNEGGLIHKEVGGIKTGMIALPCRYMNTSGEMMSLKDVQETIDLLGKIITK